jgi:cellulose synthase/poly-beta-1,6-N-acetylglucosamine synthase-like glycosyltransferase
MKRITIDVLIAAFNEEGIIGKTIRSIASQTDIGHAQFTVHIIANGCTDNTVEEVRQTIHRMPKKSNIAFNVYDLPETGKTKALNYGLEHVTSPIVISIDGDTVLSPNCFSETLALFEDPKVMVGGPLPQMVISKPNCNRLIGKMQKTANICGRIYECTAPAGCMIAYRREVFDKYPLTIAADDTWLVFTAAYKYGWDAVRVTRDATVWVVAPQQWVDYIKQESRFLRVSNQLLEVFPEFKKVFKAQRQAIRQAAKEYRSVIKDELKQRKVHLIHWKHRAFLQKLCDENAELMASELLSADNRWEAILTTKRTPPETC